MRGARAVILGLLIALALSGCMERSGPVATVQPHNDLDALAYAQPVPLGPGDTILVGERWF